jgi:hypothetical protein
VWLGGALMLTVYGLHVAGVDFDRFQVDVYKNALTSATMFFAGGACYYARRRWGHIVPAPVAWIAVTAWLALMTMRQLHGGSFPLPSAAVFGRYLWLTLLVSCLVLLSVPPRRRGVDRFAGNLCYGVYLNHFIAAALLLSRLPSRAVASGGLAPGLAVLAGSIVLAALTYLLVEYPFERVRARVRGVTIPAAPATARTLRPLPVIAAVTVIACLAGPAGWTVERLNGAAAGKTLPLSGAFQIRWKPEVSDAARQRIESDFALVTEGPVTRDPRHRTYQYRLPQPTKSRVRELITQPAVEDTARIDVQRYEIAQ